MPLVQIVFHLPLEARLSGEDPLLVHQHGVAGVKVVLDESRVPGPVAVKDLKNVFRVKPFLKTFF